MMLGLIAGLMYSQKVNAQLNVNVNIGAQPLWGPVGYDHVDYYYLPDVDSYYSVPQRQFIYLDGNSWAFGPSLPSRYGNYDLYNGYKVVVNSPKPYLHHNDYKVKYAKFKGKSGQAIISKSKNPKYFVVKGHPGKGFKQAGYSPGNGKGKQKVQDNKMGRGNSKGNGKGKH